MQMDILAPFTYFHCRKKTVDGLFIFNESYDQRYFHFFQTF